MSVVVGFHKLLLRKASSVQNVVFELFVVVRVNFNICTAFFLHYYLYK